MLVLSPGCLEAQRSTRVSGRVVDQASERPVEGAELRLLGTDKRDVTDQDGFFRFHAIPSGAYRLEIRHLAYGIHMEDVQVETEHPLSLQIAISPEAMLLQPLTVRVYTARAFGLRASGTGIRDISREELDLSDLRGLHLGQVLERRIPGIQVRESTALAGAPMCVEYRGARFGPFDGSCRSPLVYLDGIPVANPLHLYAQLDMGDVDRMEVVPPAEAGVRFGAGALWGALVIETRAPGLRSHEREAPRGTSPITGAYDWSQEPRPHPWWRVYAYSLVGNALGLAAGVPLARECIEVASPAYDRVTSDCSTLPTLGSALAGVALPAFGSALGAQWGGQTALSKGEFFPLAISAVMALVPGYAFELSSRRGQREAISLVARVILGLGVPAAVTLSDGLFRQFRASNSSGGG